MDLPHLVLDKLHSYLIDDEGRMWCSDDHCYGDEPHYNGQLPEDIWK